MTSQHHYLAEAEIGRIWEHAGLDTWSGPGFEIAWPIVEERIRERFEFEDGWEDGYPDPPFEPLIRVYEAGYLIDT